MLQPLVRFRIKSLSRGVPLFGDDIVASIGMNGAERFLDEETREALLESDHGIARPLVRLHPQWPGALMIDNFAVQ